MYTLVRLERFQKGFISNIPETIITGNRSYALKFKEDKTFDSYLSERPTIGCDLIVYSGISYWWQTTEVTEILEDTENYVKFKTKNSIYEWRVTI